MADIATLIANYDPIGVYNRNRSIDLNNSAQAMQNLQTSKIMGLQDQLAAAQDSPWMKLNTYAPQHVQQMYKSDRDQLELGARYAQYTLGLPEDERPKAWERIRKNGAKIGLDFSDAPVEYNEGFLQSMVKAGQDPDILLRIEAAEKARQQERQWGLEDMLLQQQIAERQAQAQMNKPTERMRNFNFVRDKLVELGVPEDEATRQALQSVQGGTTINVGTGENTNNNGLGSKGRDEYDKAMGKTYADMSAKSMKSQQQAETYDVLINNARNTVNQNKDVFGPKAELKELVQGVIQTDEDFLKRRGLGVMTISDLGKQMIKEARDLGQSGINTAKEIEQIQAGLNPGASAAQILGALDAMQIISEKKRKKAAEDMLAVQSYLSGEPVPVNNSSAGEKEEIIDAADFLKGM